MGRIRSSHTTIGDNSCDVTSACVANGLGGMGIVGDSSCNADSACYRNGHSGGTGIIGNLSCTQSGAYRPTAAETRRQLVILAEKVDGAVAPPTINEAVYQQHRRAQPAESYEELQAG